MWFLPSYGRPGRCQDALDAIAAADIVAAEPSKGYVVIDETQRAEYAGLRLPRGWAVIENPAALSLCEVLNWAFARHPDLPWYGITTDDSIVRTCNWSAPLVAAAGTAGFANSADGWQTNKRMHGAVVFGGDMLRALGWWTVPGLKHSYCEDVWEAIGSALSNWRRCLDVMVEHRHAWNGKAEIDATYTKAYSHREADAARWAAFQRHELPAAISRVLKVLPDRDDRAQRLARAKSRSVMICTPIARDPTWQYLVSMLQTTRELDRLGIRHDVQFTLGSSNLPRARNGLVARFLASDYSDMLMVDDDMGWDAGAVIRLLASDQPFLGVVGRKKCEAPNSDPAVWCAGFLPGSDRGLEQDEMGAVKVGRVGTAFLKVERHVFEKMIAAHPEWKREGHADMTAEVKAQYYQFFRFDTENDGAEAGEDYVFCDRWRELGGSVMIDPTIPLKHVGVKAYEGAISEIMQEMAAAQAPPRMLEAAE